MITIDSLLDTSRTIAAELFEGRAYPWEAIPDIKAFILSLGPTLPADLFDNPAQGVWIAKSASIAPTAYIGAPCIIDEGAEVRHCAYIRGSAVIGKRCVVGNSTEIKNAVLFDEVQVPHFNYVGDSVLGYKAHMGAGCIASNVKGDRTPVSVKNGGQHIATGLKKLGAILGDHAEIGCNSVLSPGCVVGRNTTVYPLSFVRGVVPENSVYKNRSRAELVKKY
jgi:bifunctional N-acetylglucosamine-1-phosphate-uridyltransferase/glucosamine-1-phosphate-acetyltransferase GlmU-like protein